MFRLRPSQPSVRCVYQPPGFPLPRRPCHETSLWIFCLAYERQRNYAAARGGGGAHGGWEPVIHCLPCLVGEATVPAARE
jgi:hypothetical protein